MQKIILLLCFVCTLQCVHAQKPGSLEDNSLQQTAAFVRGSQIIFQDDFENETAGSFPSKWNTNKSGEVKKLNGFANKFLKIADNAVVNIPLSQPLPQNFTL